MLQRSNMNSIFGELPFSRIEHSRYPYASGLKMVPPRKSISNRHPLPLLSYLFFIARVADTFDRLKIRNKNSQLEKNFSPFPSKDDYTLSYFLFVH